MYARIPALLLGITLAATATTSSAAIFINRGQDYTFNGYLIVRQGNQPPADDGRIFFPPPAIRVYLSAYPNGENHGLIGRQDLPLTNGALHDNLFTLARRYGPTFQVVVNGIGSNEGGLKVNSIGPVAVPNPNPLPSVSPVDVAKKDALKRYAKIHPGVGNPVADGVAPAVKTVTVDELTGKIHVVCDLFGGFGGIWGRKAIQFDYDKDGQFVSQSNV